MGHEVELVEKYEYEPTFYEWQFGGGIEDVDLYNPGGLHPVDIGDVIDGRFEVFRKLGAGGFGVVWLCIHKPSNKWRALKIHAAIHSTANTNKELEILQFLQSQSSPEELEKNNIAVPIEHFYIQGPNGRHLCFVLPVFGSSSSTWSLQQNHQLESTLVAIKSVCRQLAKGIRFLHRNGIVHGDIKPKNILMKLKGIDDLNKDQMSELLGELETMPVETTSGVDPGPHAPKYFVKPVDEYWCKKLATPDIAIIDFGESFHAEKSKGDWGIPIAYAAPEVVFPEAAAGSDGFSSDVWSLACTMFEIRTADPLFAGGSSPEALVRIFELYLGPLPDMYLAAWNAESPEERERNSTTEGVDLKNDDTFSDGLLPVTWEAAELLEERGHIREGTSCTDVLEAELMQERCRNLSVSRGHDRDETIRYRYSREDTLALADLLHGILKYNPNDRLTMEHICRHSWLDDRAKYQIIYDNPNFGILGTLRSGLVLAFIIGVLAVSAVVFQHFVNGAPSSRVSSISPGVCPLKDSQELAGQVFLTQCASPTPGLL